MKIELSTGKVLELTKDEWRELLGQRSKKVDKVKPDVKAEPVEPAPDDTITLKDLADMFDEIGKAWGAKETEAKMSKSGKVDYTSKGFTELFPGVWVKFKG